MDNNDSRELYDLIRNLSKGLRKHGVKKVIRALKEINIVSESERNYAIIDYVENLVCKKLGVPTEELFNFTTRGEITIARKLCILLVRRNIDKISDDELANHYNRSRQVVHNTEKEFKGLLDGKKNRFHIDFLSIYKELEKETKEHIKSLK
jgi:hypothetical protein